MHRIYVVCCPVFSLNHDMSPDVNCLCQMSFEAFCVQAVCDPKQRGGKRVYQRVHVYCFSGSYRSEVANSLKIFILAEVTKERITFDSVHC